VQLLLFNNYETILAASASVPLQAFFKDNQVQKKAHSTSLSPSF
jgi:hypothetical protein